MRPGHYATECMELLDVITKCLEKKNKTKVPINKMGYKGFLLLHSVKGAAVLGFERGHGMAFKVLETRPNGTQRLSAPVMVKTSKIAVGLQLGYSSVYSLLMLTDEAQLEALVCETETILGKDFEVSGYPGVNSDNVTTFHRTSITAVSDGVHIKPAVISVSDSLMLCDISLSGGTISVDHDAMKEAYGQAYCGPIEVLRGKVEVPAALTDKVAEIDARLAMLSSLHVA